MLLQRSSATRQCKICDSFSGSSAFTSQLSQNTLTQTYSLFYPFETWKPSSEYPGLYSLLQFIPKWTVRMWRLVLCASYPPHPPKITTLWVVCAKIHLPFLVAYVRISASGCINEFPGHSKESLNKHRWRKLNTSCSTLRQKNFG